MWSVTNTGRRACGVRRRGHGGARYARVLLEQITCLIGEVGWSDVAAGIDTGGRLCGSARMVYRHEQTQENRAAQRYNGTRDSAAGKGYGATLWWPLRPLCAVSRSWRVPHRQWVRATS